ncbi:CapA family protein [Microvenator marinus]|uniref:CapA family protein n=1 Tax=Microvenator marinus TaxID=2600177 RepID=A0A5B8XZL9_9DELT|nr:CapA family protein [Microvenator marinus]QED28839.1 CapA family protein [Microvenator marinus]
MKLRARISLVLLLLTPLASAEPKPKPAEIRIVFLGDIIPHAKVQRRVFADDVRIHADIKPHLDAADFVVANLETPVAQGLAIDGKIRQDPAHFDGEVYTDFPRFNAHPKLLAELKLLGIDLLGVANNHALDRGELGLEMTLDAIKKAGMYHAGHTAHSPLHIQKINGANFAFYACVFRNLYPSRPEPRGIEICTDLGLQRASKAAKTHDAALIVFPHWGAENTEKPTYEQRKFAKKALEVATAVVGHHPHVVQPSETKDGRHLTYSLGNFISNQQRSAQKNGLVLTLLFAPDPNGPPGLLRASYQGTRATPGL